MNELTTKRSFDNNRQQWWNGYRDILWQYSFSDTKNINNDQ